MAQNTYTVTAPNGKSLSITGDTPPTERELDEIFTAANVQAVSKTPAKAFAPEITPEQRRRGYMSGPEDFMAPEDQNIFNQDVSKSVAQGVGGLFTGVGKLATGTYHAIADPLVKGYEESGATGTLGELLKLPYGLVKGATDARLAVQEKGKTAESLPERLAYKVLGQVPFLGPAIASIGEDIGSGKPKAMGEGVLNALVLLEASPAFRAMTNAGKAEAIAAIKRGASKLPVPELVKTGIGKAVQNPGMAIAGGIEGYKLGGTPGAVFGALGLPPALRYVRGFFKDTADEIAEKRAYQEKQVEKRNTRSDTIRATRRQETLSDRVDKATSDRDKTIERDAQAHGVRTEAREHTEAVLQRKLQRDAEDAALARQIKELDTLSRDAKTKDIRDSALAERKVAVAKQNAVVDARRAEDRANAVSDTGERYARQDQRAADYRAAQNAAIHEKNIKDLAKANTAAELAAAKELAEYYIQLAKNLDEGVKYTLRKELEKSVAEAQARLTQGLEPQPPVMTTRTSSMEDGTQKTVTQQFRQPTKASAEPVPNAGASSGTTTTGQSSARPETSTAPVRNEPDIYQQLRDQANEEDVPITRLTGAEGAMVANTIRGIRSGERRFLTTEEMRYPEIQEAWKLANAQRAGVTHAARPPSATKLEREAIIQIEDGKGGRR
jgi:hypothetical protein